MENIVLCALLAVVAVLIFDMLIYAILKSK